MTIHWTDNREAVIDDIAIALIAGQFDIHFSDACDLTPRKSDPTFQMYRRMAKSAMDRMDQLGGDRIWCLKVEP